MTLSYFFKVKDCVLLISRKWWELAEKNEYYDLDRFWYLSTNDTITKTAHHGNDLLFQGVLIWNVNISDSERHRKKCDLTKYQEL